MANKIINDGRIEQVYPVASGDSEGRNGPFTWHRYDIKVNGVKYACFKDDLAKTFKTGVIITFAYKTEVKGEFENHTILEIFKASNWDENGVLRVEAEDMSDVWDTGAPATEEAKTVASHSQPAPQAPQKEYFNGAGWGQSMNQGAIAFPFSEYVTKDFDGWSQWMEKVLEFAVHWYAHNEPGPKGATEWLEVSHAAPDSPVEPQEQAEQTEIGEPEDTPRYQAYKAGNMDAADPSWTPPPERSESDFQSLGDALPKPDTMIYVDVKEGGDPDKSALEPEQNISIIPMDPPRPTHSDDEGFRVKGEVTVSEPEQTNTKEFKPVVGYVLDTGAGPTGQKPEPVEQKDELQIRKDWLNKVWGPFGKHYPNLKSAELKGFANKIVEWFTDEPGKEQYTGAEEFFNSKGADYSLSGFSKFLIEQAGNYLHMLDQSQPKLSVQEQAEQS